MTTRLTQNQLEAMANALLRVNAAQDELRKAQNALTSANAPQSTKIVANDAATTLHTLRGLVHSAMIGSSEEGE